jgi:hypothetical protein
MRDAQPGVLVPRSAPLRPAPAQADGITWSRAAACEVSNNLRTRRQADTDWWHGLCDTLAGPMVGVSRLSI